MDLPRTLHTHGCHGSASLRESDLLALMETYPDLRPVFEEVQFLRDRADELEARLALAESF